MLWLAQAPANIALIKYMGKKDEGSNVPANASLSYTLNDLLTTVELKTLPGKKDLWEPLNSPGAAEFNLSAEAQQRYLNHLQRIKKQYDYEGSFLVESCNNFPISSGLASSASSFAALTKCAVLALSELTQKPVLTNDEQAQLSRLGSGSSCRSFYSPWALWEGEAVKAIDLPYKHLLHEVIIVSSEAKHVSSSQAHQLVKTSPFYKGRSKKAEEHLRLLLNAFQSQDWASAYSICWREFQDMHQLFSTCEQPFSYISEHSQEILDILQKFWREKGDGPLVTMDAGPNIHLLYRPDQSDLMQHFKQDHLVNNYDVL